MYMKVSSYVVLDYVEGHADLETDGGMEKWKLLRYQGLRFGVSVG